MGSQKVTRLNERLNSLVDSSKATNDDDDDEDYMGMDDFASGSVRTHVIFSDNLEKGTNHLLPLSIPLYILIRRLMSTVRTASSATSLLPNRKSKPMEKSKSKKLAKGKAKVEKDPAVLAAEAMELEAAAAVSLLPGEREGTRL